MPNNAPIGVAYSDQAINGGSIDNTPIGATTRSTAKVTTLDASGATTLSGAITSTGGLSTVGANAIASTSASTLGFFGAAVAAQPAMSANAAVATTAAINSSISSSCFGYTSAQATAIISLVNGMRAAGVTLGLWAT